MFCEHGPEGQSAPRFKAVLGERGPQSQTGVSVDGKGITHSMRSHAFLQLWKLLQGGKISLEEGFIHGKDRIPLTRSGPRDPQWHRQGHPVELSIVSSIEV